MLRAVVAQLEPGEAICPILVRYFSAAFCFTEGQGYKIYGWFPDGTGALKDAGIDSLLVKRIEETRGKWDNPASDSIDLDFHPVTGTRLPEERP